MSGFVVKKLMAVSKQYYLLKKMEDIERKLRKLRNAAMLLLLELSAVKLCVRYLQSVHLCW